MITTKARIDYESIKQIYVSAYVTDTGVPQLTSTAEIIVDIVNTNDNEPVFTLPEYRFTVAENSPKGTHIGKIDAKDGDDGELLVCDLYVVCVFFSTLNSTCSQYANKHVFSKTSENYGS